MIRLAHLINPVPVGPESDLAIAQPVTFASMVSARTFGKRDMDLEVSLLAVQHREETPVPLPDTFRRLPDLDRSALDLGTFLHPRRLPLIADLLGRMFDGCEADYLIYTNVDIALQPFFYLTVADIVRQGHDAFVINRRTIPNHYSGPAELPLMYAEIGAEHPGWDCFVFKRDLFPRFDLDQIIIGTGWIGRALITNLICLAERFRLFETRHLTFHIGNDQVWKKADYNDYLYHNREAGRRILNRFDSRCGPLDRQSLPGRFFSHLDMNL